MIAAKKYWVRRSFPSRLVTALALVAFSTEALSERTSNSWVDTNYALCEGIGASASGRINVALEYTRTDDTIEVTSLNIVLQYQHPTSTTATITVTNPSGVAETITLQAPWFDTISAPGSKSLYLPRIRTSEYGPAPNEQRSFKMKAGDAISFFVSNLFTVAGGNCPTSFEETLVVL